MNVAPYACRFAIAVVAALALSGCGESRAPAMASSPGAASIGPDNSSNASAGEVVHDEATPSSSAPEDVAATEPAARSGDTKPSATEIRSGPPLRTADISFDDIKFEMLKGEPFRRSMITSKIEALDGRPVRIRGFILPSFQQTGLTQFVLVRDNLSCCFGPGAALYDCIVVDMQPGKSTDYNIAPVTVEGTFSIRELLDSDGKALAIYHLDGETVR